MKIAEVKLVPGLTKEDNELVDVAARHALLNLGNVEVLGAAMYGSSIALAGLKRAGVLRNMPTAAGLKEVVSRYDGKVAGHKAQRLIDGSAHLTSAILLDQGMEPLEAYGTNYGAAHRSAGNLVVGMHDLLAVAGKYDPAIFTNTLGDISRELILKDGHNDSVRSRHES